MNALESKALDSYSYDPRTQRLVVRAKWGKEYSFDEVPQWCIDQFLASKSKGHYFHHMIRKYYSDTSTNPEDAHGGTTPAAPETD